MNAQRIWLAACKTRLRSRIFAAVKARRGLGRSGRPRLVRRQIHLATRCANRGDVLRELLPVMLGPLV